MQKLTFSISEALNFGWSQFKAKPLFWVVAFGLLMMFGSLMSGDYNFQDDSNTQIEEVSHYNGRESVLGALTENVDSLTNNGSTAAISSPLALFLLTVLAILVIPVVIFFLLVSLFPQLGFTKLLIDATRGKELRYETILSMVNFPLVIRWAVMTFIYLLLVAFGFLLIFPGLYFLTKYMFITFVMVDNPSLDCKAVRERSALLTKGVKLKLLGFIILSIIIVIIGFFALLIGAYIAMIVLYLALAYIYNTLNNQLNVQPVSQPVTPLTGEQTNDIIR